LRQRSSQILDFMEHPANCQDRVFSYLMENGKETEWGKKFEYSSIKSIDEYRQRVPLQDYESLKPYIERLMRGEQNLLWNSPVKWFAKSSGTTSDKSKFIPVTEQAIEDCHYKGTTDMLALYCQHNENSKIFDGKGLIVGGSHQINQLNSQSYYGDLSAVLMQNMSFFGQLFRTPDLSIALMDDWEKKIEAMAQATLHENVTNISGVPTWTLVLIKRLFELTGKNNLSDIWPDLELYIHGGVSFTPYREQFHKVIKSDKMRFYDVYNASEGFFAFQMNNTDDDMLLHTNNGIFYEFIPSTEILNEHPKTVLIDEVDTSTNYALVISTNNGLWRYVVGDTIKFTSIKPHKIQVSGRIKHFINAFGEEVIVDNSDRAIAAASQLTGAEVRDYTVAPVYFSFGGKGGHEWIIEFEKMPHDIDAFAQILDTQLRAINSDYDAKRQKDIALQNLIIDVAPDGTFHSWLKSKGKLGGQHKVPRLSNDRKLVEELLAIINNH
jgi:hypothetical protein